MAAIQQLEVEKLPHSWQKMQCFFCLLIEEYIIFLDLNSEQIIP